MKKNCETHPYENVRSASFQSGSHLFLQKTSNGTSLLTQSYLKIATKTYVAFNVLTNINAITQAVNPPNKVNITPSISSGILLSTNTTMENPAMRAD
mmetsp:Transcript_27311/g.55978  ORF Transcript_27311/g.55978 Transcript_27311/m.55978 type:complete len:97 (-) Transcript_27311:327-617(-)